jgi:proline iminopeptidase
MKSCNIVFLLFATLNLTCHDKKVQDEGYVNVKGGKVWYKIFGSERNKTPILLLHGGPGFPSDYLTSIQELASDRPVIFYDQLGCGRSDKPDDTSLWNIKRFAEEVSTLRTELGLDSIHLFGHSWGTMLLAEYISTYPGGIKSIVFSSPIFNTRQHLQNVNQLKLNLPPAIRDTLLFHERNGTISSAAFQKAYQEFVNRHWCRMFPFPEDIQKSMSYPSSEVFKTMWGDYEFYCPGNLRDFDRTAVLQEIKVPTLFTCGRYDLITPETTEGYSSQIKGAQFVIFEKSAHMTMNEEPDTYVKIIRDFLNKNE